MKSTDISNQFYKKLGHKGLATQLGENRKSADILMAKKILKKSDQILDLGCGYGRLSLPLAKEGYAVTGLDLAPNFIREARKRAKDAGVKIRYDIGSMTELPYEKESFDKVICMWSSFNHLLAKREQVKSLNEVFRVLKENGIAFFEMLNGGSAHMQKLLKEEGGGVDKRLWGETHQGVKNVSYMHDKESLYRVCDASKFTKYEVKFQNMGDKRRLVMYLYK